MSLHTDILDKQRLEILPIMTDFSEKSFYLAGGTGLALQIGHRDSIDFDFFKEGDFDTGLLIEKISSIFRSHKVLITQQDRNTVSCLIDDGVQMSFFGYRHSLLGPLIVSPYFNIASILDIGCMKLSAISSRYLEKDYIDLYFILQNIPFATLIDGFEKKYPNFDKTLILKSMV